MLFLIIETDQPLADLNLFLKFVQNSDLVSYNFAPIIKKCKIHIIVSCYKKNVKLNLSNNIDPHYFCSWNLRHHSNLKNTQKQSSKINWRLKLERFDQSHEVWMFHQDLLGRMFHKNFARSEDKNALKILQNPQETPLCDCYCTLEVYIQLWHCKTATMSLFLHHKLKNFIKVLNMPLLSTSSILDLKNSLFYKTTLICDGTEMHL